MIDQQQAEILHDLVVRALGLDAHGNVIAVPPGFDIATVADALAGIMAEKDGDGMRPLMVEFLARLGPDLVAAQIDASGTPSATRLEKYIDGAADLLAALGVATTTKASRRMMAHRRGAMLNVPGWLPLEVLDALARIAVAVGAEGVHFAPALASEVEMQAASGRTARAIIEETAKLLATIDPGFEGAVTPTAVELATRRLTLTSAANDATAPAVIPFRRTAGIETRSGRRVCTVENIVDAVTVLGKVTGVTLSGSELGVMSLGEDTALPGSGASIVRTSAGWELWRDEVSRG